MWNAQTQSLASANFYNVPSYSNTFAGGGGCPGGNCSASFAGNTLGTMSGGYGGIPFGSYKNPSPAMASAIQNGGFGAPQAGGGSFMGGLSQGIGLLSSIANIYLGFQSLSLAKKRYKIAREQWDETKKEMENIRTVRKNVSKAYFEH